MVHYCAHCGREMDGVWTRCRVRHGFGCETAGEMRARLGASPEPVHQHHYIDPMARVVLIAEHVRRGDANQAMRVIRETAEHAHENALAGYGPLGQ